MKLGSSRLHMQLWRGFGALINPEISRGFANSSRSFAANVDLMSNDGHRPRPATFCCLFLSQRLQVTVPLNYGSIKFVIISKGHKIYKKSKVRSLLWDQEKWAKSIICSTAWLLGKYLEFDVNPNLSLVISVEREDGIHYLPHCITSDCPMLLFPHCHTATKSWKLQCSHITYNSTKAK